MGCHCERGSLHAGLSGPARVPLLARLALTGVARLANPDEEALADLRLAVTEAAANACCHAYDGWDGDVTLHLSLRGDDGSR